MFEAPLFALIIGGVVSSIAFLVNAARRQGRMQVWRQAAEQAHLTDVSTRSELFGQSLHGRAGELRVTMSGYRRGKHERGTRIQVDTGARFTLRLEGVGTAIGKRFVGLREVEIGDPDFDATCFIEAPAPLALAVLTPAVRSSLPLVLRGHVPVARSSADVRASYVNGVLQVELREHWFAPGFIVPELLQALIVFARSLVAPADIGARLAENFRAEPVAGVRLQILLTLAREFPDHRATRPLLLAGLEDANDEVRLRAALALGGDGLDALRALASRPDADDECRARAITALGDRLSTDQLQATLRESPATRRVRTACACVEALSARSGGEVERVLVGALQDAWPVVRLTAVRALGKAGSAASVPPLRDLAAAEGELRSAVRQAIAEIQSRLPGAGPGQLTLADGEAGALSLAEGETGALSLVETAGAARPPASEAGDAPSPSTEPPADDVRPIPPPVRERSKA